MELSDRDNKLVSLVTSVNTLPLVSKGKEVSVSNDELIIHFTLVEDTWDNCIREDMECHWADLVTILQEHITTMNKYKTRMIIPASFKDISEEYEPARYGEKHEKAGQIKFREDGRPHIKRCKDNVKTVYLLPLDMDGGLSIVEAKERFSEYEYCAYTSSGHRTEEKFGKDAFRIFLPFSRPLTAKEYELRQKAFREWLGTELDQSSVDVARGFYIPSYLHENRNNGHTAWHNKGKLLDPDMFDEAEEVVYEPNPIQTGVSGAEIKGKILWDTLDIVALFKSLGLYKSSGGGGKHNVMCPWHVEHSSSPDTGTCVFERTGTKKATFNCLHGGCKDRGAYEVSQKVKSDHGIDYLRQFYEVIPNEKDRKELLNTIDDEYNALMKQLEALKNKNKKG